MEKDIVKTTRLLAFLLAFLFGITGITVNAQPTQTNDKGKIYLDVTQPLDIRVNDLVARMTLEEKISQMQHQAAPIERLGIPAYNWWNECLHGVARNGIATVFPQAIGMAATWNPDLIEQEADIISTEGRAKYNEAIAKDQHGIYQGLTFWSPNINIFRDPRWGRGQETYGEDPFLTSRIGVAFVKGLQGNDPKYFKVISTAKHFAVHSGPEPDRHKFDAWASERDLWETYLPAFEALVKEAKVYSVMGAYNRVYGTPACASDLLMDKILRTRWGFKGYVVSDCWAVSDFYNSHKFVPNSEKASTLAVKAGTDLSCGPEYSSLLQAVKNGYISDAEIDVSVKRLFEARFRLGLFDPPARVPYASIPISANNTEGNRQFARKVAQQSIVLLKNEKMVLPFSKKIKSIVVMGPYAKDTSVLLGNYNGNPEKPVTIYKGIENRSGKNLKITYALGVDVPQSTVKMGEDLKQKLADEAMKVAEKAEVVVFVGGISPKLEGEEMNVKIEGFSGGDRTNLEMPADQVKFLERLTASGKPVVLLLTNGSALAVNYAAEKVPAIVECWYPGEEGGNAVADVLFGDYNPAGRLPVTFYKSVNDLPAFDDYSMSGRTYKYFKGQPLYPFGYGLSFTKFDYSESKIERTGEDLAVEVKIKNSGNFDGDEVLQIYARQPESVKDRPIKTLVGWQRVNIPKGTEKKVSIRIPLDNLRHYDGKINNYEVVKGTYTFMIGASSGDIRTNIEYKID